MSSILVEAIHYDQKRNGLTTQRIPWNASGIKEIMKNALGSRFIKQTDENNEEYSHYVYRGGTEYSTEEIMEKMPNSRICEIAKSLPNFNRFVQFIVKGGMYWIPLEENDIVIQ